MSFILRPWRVTVDGYDPVLFYASTIGRARARAWRAFCSMYDVPFRDFMSRVSVRRGVAPAGFGDRLLIAGKRAYLAGEETHHVPFVRDDSDEILYSHPNDVVRLPTRPSLRPIVDGIDWVMRTRSAASRLIAEHGYGEKDFVSVADVSNDISMNWCELYPKRWASHFRGKNTGWLKESAFPKELTLYWPGGTDYWGEAFDAKDPIFILEEVDYWSTVTPEELLADWGMDSGVPEAVGRAEALAADRTERGACK